MNRDPVAKCSELLRQPLRKGWVSRRAASGDYPVTFFKRRESWGGNDEDRLTSAPWWTAEVADTDLWRLSGLVAVWGALALGPAIMN